MSNNVTDVKYSNEYCYVRGCPSMPSAVIDRLKSIGGKCNDSFNIIDLTNPHNIFYVDDKDNNQIKFLSDDSMIWDTLVNYWLELPPLTKVSKLPESWDEAVENCIEAANYDDGKDDTRNELLTKFGRVLVLRDIYRRGWIPSDGVPFWYVGNHNGELDIMKGTSISRPLSFSSSEIAKMFFSSFYNDINGVKELI